MCVKFNDEIRKLPRNRSKLQQYRDLDFHQQIKLNVNEKDRISTTTVNNILGYVSSFMRWCVINGFVDINFFEVMKLRSGLPLESSVPNTTFDNNSIRCKYSLYYHKKSIVTLRYNFQDLNDIYKREELTWK